MQRASFRRVILTILQRHRMRAAASRATILPPGVMDSLIFFIFNARRAGRIPADAISLAYFSKFQHYAIIMQAAPQHLESALSHLIAASSTLLALRFTGRICPHTISFLGRFRQLRSARRFWSR